MTQRKLAYSRSQPVGRGRWRNPQEARVEFNKLPFRGEITWENFAGDSKWSVSLWTAFSGLAILVNIN